MNSYANERTDERFSDVDPSELHKLKSRETLKRFQKNNRLRKNFGKFLRIVVFFAMIAVFVTVCILKVFVIQDVEVVGTDRYTAEELIKLLGVSKGDSLYSVRRQNTEALSSKLSLVKDVKISRKLPQTLIITLTEDTPLYYSEIYGEYFLLSDKLRVLDRVFYEEDIAEYDLIRLELPTVDRAVVGSVLEFDNASDMKYITSYLSVLESSSVYEHVDAFDMRDKFALEMICDSKYLVELSDGEELATKLSTLSQVLAQDVMKDRGKSTIDITDPAETRVISDITGDVVFSRDL